MTKRVPPTPTLPLRENARPPKASLDSGSGCMPKPEPPTSRVGEVGAGGTPLTSSRYERNIFFQPSLIQEILGAPRPEWVDELKNRRIFFVGIGTSFHAAQIAKCLWREYVSPEAEAVHSFDCVRMPQPIKAGDAAVFFSHSGAKSFTVEAAALAQKIGAMTVGVTRKNSPWEEGLVHRMEACEQEDTGAHTKSLTTALAWIARWIDDRNLIDGIRQSCSRCQDGPDFPQVPQKTDVVLIGGLAGEWVARETALKIQETAYLPARAFGIEEFLHGPRVSVGAESLAVAFSDPQEKRWDCIREYLETIRVPLLEVSPAAYKIPNNAGWLWQLFWGQRFALDICRRLGIDPDTLRNQDARYKQAGDKLKL